MMKYRTQECKFVTGAFDIYENDVPIMRVGYPGWTYEKAQSRAELIVKAVNAHDDLVEALELALKAVDHEDLGTTRMETNTFFYEACWDAKIKIKQALEKVDE